MNNIYQVIWSQVKQCYVVTSELAKRRGKGCGARSLRVAAVSMGVTAALLSAWTGVGTSVVHAESVNVASDSKITISENKSGVTYNLNGSNITFTVASGGSVHDIYGSGTASISLNTVYVYGTVSGSYVTGGYAFNGGEVTENTVTVSGDAALINGAVYGGNASNGLQASGSATGNKVFIYGGTVNGKDGVYGGYSYSRDANENKVTIEDGSVVSVKGGYSTARSGSAIKNRVTISGGTVTSTGVRAVVGGAGGSTSEDSVTQENEVIIKGNAKIKGSVIGGADAAYAAVVNKNTVTIKESAVIDGSMYGGYGNLNVKDKTENKVFIEGGSVSGNVYGGYITNYSMGASEEPAGNVKKNEVHITGGTVGTNDKTVVAGGYVDEYATGAAMDNAVTITGGTVKSRVFGGHVNNATSAATGNKLNISVADTSVADTVLERNAYGGYAIGTGEVSNNNVTITGGTLNYNVYAGYSVGGAARNNTVDISGKNTNVGFGVYGGYNNETDNAEFTVNNNTVKITDATIGGAVSGGDGDQDVFENRVEITGGKLGQMDAVSLVTGGDAYDGSATKNEVKISGGTQLIGEVYGGYSSNSKTANNIVTIDNTTVKKAEEGYRGNVFGGSSQGDATGNRVTISGAETQVEGKVYGGNVFKSKVSADATSNTVEIKGGTIGKSDGDTVFGGYTNNGDSKQNNVIITGGTVNGDVYGGYSGYYNNIYGDSDQNNVIIKGGTVNGNVYGGYSDSSDATGNSVTITGGTVNGDVVGGYAYSDAAKNTVTLSNCTINGDVYGIWTWGEGETMKNAVNLTGKVSGLNGEYSVVSGCGGSNADNTGNELHIGGTKTYNESGEPVVSKGEAWQGMTGDVVTNKISTVELFESIVYHNVKWDENVPALEVKTLYDVDAIDITNLAFDSLGTGTMALLKATADDSDLSAITLTYKDGSTVVTGKEINASGVVISGGTPSTEKDGVNGVKLTSTSSDKVLLASDKKAINYSKGATTVSAITFGTFDIDKGARDLTGSSFATANTVDAKDLKFADTANALKKNESITLVTNATGITTTVANETGKTIAIKDYKDAQKIKYNATASGTVTSAGGAVKYTVGSVTVSDIDVSQWNGTTSAVTASWDTKNAAVTTNGISVSGMNPGDTKTILTAASGSDFSNVTLDAGAWQEGGAITDTAVNGVSIAGETTGGGVKVSDDKSQLVYQQDKKNVTGITLGAFDASKAARSFGSGDDLRSATINAEGFSISNLDATKASVVVVDATNAIKDDSSGATLKKFEKQNVGDAVAFEDKIAETVLTFSGTHQDALEQNDAQTQIVYKVGDKNVTGVKFDGEVAWSDSAYYEADAGYKFAATDVDAAGLTVTGSSTAVLTKGDAMTLLSAEGMKANITAAPADAGGVDLSYTEKGISFTGKTKGEVKAADNAVKYEVTGVGMNSVDIGEVAWQKGATLVDNNDASYDFTGVKEIGTKNFAVTYADGVPQTVAKGDSMTLIAANETLQDIVKEETNTWNYPDAYEPVAGVTLKGEINGKLSKSGNNVVFTATENKATALTFGKVEWTGDTALIDHSKTLTNVSFDGATVDTSNIDFYKEMYIEADQTMTLVSNFGGEAKVTPESTKYMVGTAYEGESETKMEGDNLIIHTTTAAGLSEQTHKTVMAMEAGMALLAGGGEHVGKALEGLGDAANRGPDGTSVGVSIGGSGNRYETGSHVNVNAWNAVVAVGAKRELKQGALEYGVFGEYGKGSYKLYNDDGGKGDGDAHYAGGGLMVKWTNKHDVYAEASFRLGRMSDSADNILEGGGNKYGYDVHANYYGAHVGIGKVFNYKGGKSLDVYGKYFYTKRDGVEYDAKQHYNLDSVASSVLRIGARYGTTDKKWNWYGGLAYEYEFDGEAKGTVNGTEIRAASIKGSSVRGEFGMRMDATKDNPWRTDISIYGYGGKHRGFGGSVNVAYTF